MVVTTNIPDGTHEFALASLDYLLGDFVEFGEAKELAYYDIPQIILNLAEVKHNAKFSKELFPQMGEKFVADNKELFTSLNLKLNGMR